MLKRLSIKNYALIDALDISFPEHLVIITGETGAGKSILLGALSLLLGAKGDKTAIKNADSNCVVEAEFADESGETILRRVLTPQGRSRIFVNDEPADMEELKSLSRRLIDIHSQNSQLLLQDDKFQLSVLDSYCDNKDVLYSYAEAYTQLKNATAELQEAKTLLDKELRHRDIVSAEYQELVAAHIVDGELDALDQEQKQLANAEEIKRNLNMALDSL
ncbi:MAG: AAA family ATPase, partial [Bacteroidales bacterium]|nr:AAA family ATPase [Bacteroidales bacterium]